MIEARDREYLNDNDYNIALGRVVLEDGYYSDEFSYNVGDRIYPFSNENVGGFLKKFNLKDKKVATVGSSGDQVLNSILLGATDITFIDGNPMARYYVELKLASIKNLTFKECLDFFTKENILDWKYYSKVSHDLSPEAKLFWDNIMLLENGEYTDINIPVYYNLFKDYMFESYKYANSYYRNLVEFEKLKSLIPNVRIDYVLEEFKNFPNALSGKKFDLILLSNIADYVSEDSFEKRVKYLYDNNLNKGGAIQVNYNFNNGKIKIKNFRGLINKCNRSKCKFKRILVRSAGDFGQYSISGHSYVSSEFLEKG